MNKLIYIAIFSLVFIRCNTNKKQEIKIDSNSINSVRIDGKKSFDKVNELPKKEILKPSSKKVRSITNTQFIIEQNKAGQFICGKKVPTSLPKSFLVKRKTEWQEEDGDKWEQEYFLVSENGKELLTYTVRKDYKTKKRNIINEIIIKSGKFKTINNIGVNSTIEEFIKAYPDYSIWYTYVGDMFVIQSKTMEIQFLLNKTDFVGNKESLYDGDMVILKASDFKINSKISLIRI